MAEGFHSNPVLGHVYTLGGGAPVRLRLARASDAAAIKRLVEDHELGRGEVEAARLVHFDPRRRYVLCAAGLRGSTEAVLGVGAIRLEAAAEPDLLVVGEEAPAEIAGLLRQALVAAAARRGRDRAA
ncbi:MAG TPA: hypothetical protein VKR21_09080 [Solirubrobacteraceae bacterium]|nr:hypothetical protein [Solirubrobacteraceae bacterium]